MTRLISVVIPSYNHRNFVGEAIASVRCPDLSAGRDRRDRRRFDGRQLRIHPERVRQRPRPPVAARQRAARTPPSTTRSRRRVANGSRSSTPTTSTRPGASPSFSSSHRATTTISSSPTSRSVTSADRSDTRTRRCNRMRGPPRPPNAAASSRPCCAAISRLTTSNLMMRKSVFEAIGAVPAVPLLPRLGFPVAQRSAARRIGWLREQLSELPAARRPIRIREPDQWRHITERGLVYAAFLAPARIRMRRDSARSSSTPIMCVGVSRIRTRRRISLASE